jgi:hypothetical protein
MVHAHHDLEDRLVERLAALAVNNRSKLVNFSDERLAVGQQAALALGEAQTRPPLAGFPGPGDRLGHLGLRRNLEPAHLLARARAGRDQLACHNRAGSGNSGDGHGSKSKPTTQ